MEGNNLSSGHDGLSNVKILEHYGMFDPPEGPRWVTVKCCFHDDRNASARSNGFGFLCNACGTSGDALKLLMEREGIDYSTAVGLYEEITGQECKPLRKEAFRKRVSFDLPSEKRSYERDSGIFSSRISGRSAPRKRPRFSGGEA